MTFSDIIGHEQQKKLLRQAFAAGKLAHAYLFSGIEGIGKRLMAQALARLIFCNADNGCGECSSCQRIDHNNHPDLHLIEADGQFIKIEQIRELQKSLAFRPLEAPRHIVIIEAAERMNSYAANALLKTLEEPPHDTIIILLSSQPEALYTTVRSRCQTLPFSRLSHKEISRVLRAQIADKVERDILAALAQGSLSKAFGADRDMYLSTRKEIFSRICRLRPSTVIPLLELAAELAQDRDYALSVIDILTSCYRDLFIMAAKGSAAQVINADLEQEIYPMAARHSVAAANAKLQSLIRCRSYLNHNVNPQLAMEWLLTQLVKEEINPEAPTYTS